MEKNQNSPLQSTRWGRAAAWHWLQVEEIEDVAREIQLILKAKPPTDLREGWNLLKQGIHLLHARPKSVRDAACQEVVREIERGGGFSLLDLPILKCWPKDGGRFVTL